mmetsp:Transcript_35301/g.49004  ORF Transcript_35301/g.49004 Transcript_35301/m.49004 type:complete len:266 (-) Transcript_35301:164-961(-)
MNVERYFDNVVFPHRTAIPPQPPLCPGFTYMTVMRDPIDRAVSSMDYNLPGRRVNKAKLWLSQYHMEPGNIVSGHSAITNFYIRSLMGSQVFYNPRDEVNRTHLELAKMILSHVHLVLTMDCLAQKGGQKAMKLVLGWNKTDSNSMKGNVRGDSEPAHRGGIHGQARRKLKNAPVKLSPKEWTIAKFGIDWWNDFLKANELDLELYKHAQLLSSKYCPNTKDRLNQVTETDHNVSNRWSKDAGLKSTFTSLGPAATLNLYHLGMK